MYRNPSFWLAVILFAVYWTVAPLLPPGDRLEALRLASLSGSLAVVIAYGPYALSSLRQRYPDEVQQLSMGIALGFFGLFGNGAWFLLWRLAGRPAWMPDALVSGFFLYLGVLASILHLTAPGALGGIPRRNLILLGAAGGLTAFSLVLIGWSEPDARWLVAMLEPWLSD